MKIASIFVIMSISITTSINAQSVGNSKEKIEKMYTTYINYRSDKKNCSCQNPGETKELKTSINSLIAEFNQAKYFPGFTDVGKENSDHYLELLFESNNDLFIQTAMELMYTQVLAKNADAVQYATYIDQKSYSKTKLQVYGTLVKAENICLPPGEIKFTVMPIEDSKNVEARRAQIGLSTIHEMVENYRNRIVGK